MKCKLDMLPESVECLAIMQVDTESPDWPHRGGCAICKNRISPGVLDLKFDELSTGKVGFGDPSLPACLHVRSAKGEPAVMGLSLRPTARLDIGVRKIPNRWHRFWYRVLLGWRWEKLK